MVPSHPGWRTVPTQPTQQSTSTTQLYTQLIHVSITQTYTASLHTASLRAAADAAAAAAIAPPAAVLRGTAVAAGRVVVAAGGLVVAGRRGHALARHGRLDQRVRPARATASGRRPQHQPVRRGRRRRCRARDGAALHAVELFFNIIRGLVLRSGLGMVRSRECVSRDKTVCCVYSVAAKVSSGPRTPAAHRESRGATPMATPNAPTHAASERRHGRASRWCTYT